MSLVTTFKQITLVDCFLNEVNGRSWPTAKDVLQRHDSPMRFTAPFLLAQSLL